MKRFLLYMFTAWMVVSFPGSVVWANTVISREEIIKRALDCVSQKYKQSQQLSWSDVCYSSSAQSDNSADVSEASNSKSEGYKSVYSKEELEAGMDLSFEPQESLTQFEIAPEFSYYRYEEPNFAKLKGNMYGIKASLTHRISENQQIRSFEDIFSDPNKINMYRFEGHFIGGKLDYDSNGTGTDNGEPNYMVEGRGIVGYDIPISINSRMTPYMGAGYRYLKDDSGGRTTSTGAAGYDRESHYVYIPVGVETNTHLSRTWDIGATVEYDWFLGGKQFSHLEDVDSSLNEVRNEQNSGYGLRGSVKLTKITEGPNFFVEPFVRYWSIDSSDITAITFNGILIAGALDPANTTTEYGVNLGVRF